MSELYHHGVKGMKWGVRRKSSASSKKETKTEKTKKTFNKKKAITIAGMTAASVAITAIGLHAMSNKNVQGSIFKGMNTVDKMFKKHDDFSGYEYPTDKHGNRIVDIDAYMREHKTGLYKED